MALADSEVSQANSMQSFQVQLSAELQSIRGRLRDLYKREGRPTDVAEERNALLDLTATLENQLRVSSQESAVLRKALALVGSALYRAEDIITAQANLVVCNGFDGPMGIDTTSGE